MVFHCIKGGAEHRFNQGGRNTALFQYNLTELSPLVL